MHFFYDLLPIIIFFVAYKLYGIFTATMVAIVAVLVQLTATIVRGKKPEMMQLVTLGMVIVLGGATLLFKNELFIKWKPTAVYWALGATFAITAWFSQKNLVQKMLEKNLELPAKAWSMLNTSWCIFFFVMGILNLLVVYNFDTDTWVNFKLFGTLILTLIFAGVQGVMISRYIDHDNASEKKT
ncbi:MAG: septation protein A [Candidatus Berkiella sp.]